MLQIDPLKSRCFQKQQYPERNIRLKELFGENNYSVSHTSSKAFTILYEQLQLLL